MFIQNTSLKFYNQFHLKMKDRVLNIIQIKNAQLFVIGFFLISSLFTIITPFASASHATVNILATDLTTSAPVAIQVFDPVATGDGIAGRM